MKLQPLSNLTEKSVDASPSILSVTKLVSSLFVILTYLTSLSTKVPAAIAVPKETIVFSEVGQLTILLLTSAILPIDKLLVAP